VGSDQRLVLDSVLALSGRKLHPHPLITDNGMTDARLKELTLPLRPLDIVETALVYLALLVACIFILFFTLHSCQYGLVSKTKGRV
jgi:hypothetical protein